MKRLLFLLTLFLLAAPLPRAGAADRALLIGVGRYQISRANLPGIDKDLAAMRQVAGLMGFGQVKVIQDEAATLEGIRQGIRSWLINQAAPNDRVLLYFSGHGSQIPDQNGDEADQADEVLLPHNAAVENQALVRSFPDDEFGSLLAKIRARTILVLIDSCHSGTATKVYRKITLEGAPPASDLHTKFFIYPGMPEVQAKGSFAVEESVRSNRNVISLSAGRDNEKAVATPNGSMFTSAVFETVSAAAKKDKRLSLRELEQATTRYIESHVSDPKRVHHPYLFGNLELASVNLFRRYGGPPPPSTPSPPSPPHQASPWVELENLARAAAYRLPISANQPRFRIGDQLTITCRVPESGYLNVLNVKEGDRSVTVLFPNKYHPENYVPGNSTITIPDKDDRFVLRAYEPIGRNLVVVFHSKKPINAYQDGKGAAQELFKTMSPKTYGALKSLRGLEIQPKASSGYYGAGDLVTVVEK